MSEVLTGKNSELIAKRWAKALMELALEDNNISKEDILSDLKNVSETIFSSEELSNVINNPAVSVNEKQIVLCKLFENKLIPMVYNFVFVLNLKKRVNIISQIAVEFEEELNKFKNIVHVNVTSAIDLNGDRKENIKTKIARKLEKDVVDAEIDILKMLGVEIKCTFQTVFVDDFGKNYRNLVFCGTVGTGKSFLACCIAHELLENCHSVLYMSAPQLCDTMAQYQFGNDREGKAEFSRELYDCELLIIDDLGTELTNSFVASSLFTIVSERHNHNHPTIITTNLSLQDIRDRYSDRTLSRVTGNYDFILLSGPDVRQLL